jgi:hypothetical protein
MALWIAIGLAVAAVVVLCVVIAKDPGPSPDDTAVGYEAAWNRLDFGALFDLSGEELRDGMNRAEFVGAKRAAMGEAVSPRADARVAVESVDTSGDVAHTITTVSTHEGVVSNDVVLARRNGRWVVVGYSLRVPPEGPPDVPADAEQPNGLDGTRG